MDQRPRGAVGGRGSARRPASCTPCWQTARGCAAGSVASACWTARARRSRRRSGWGRCSSQRRCRARCSCTRTPASPSFPAAEADVRDVRLAAGGRAARERRKAAPRRRWWRRCSLPGRHQGDDAPVHKVCGGATCVALTSRPRHPRWPHAPLRGTAAAVGTARRCASGRDWPDRAAVVVPDAGGARLARLRPRSAQVRVSRNFGDPPRGSLNPSLPSTLHSWRFGLSCDCVLGERASPLPLWHRRALWLRACPPVTRHRRCRSPCGTATTSLFRTSS